jgi:hypothetical protein
MPSTLITVATPAQATRQIFAFHPAALRPIQRPCAYGAFTWSPLSVTPDRRLLLLFTAFVRLIVD